MVFACKKCKKVFRKDMTDYDEVDEYCPHCDNKYVVEAKMPEMTVGFEIEDPRLNSRLMRDQRMKKGFTGGNLQEMQDMQDMQELMQ